MSIYQPLKSFPWLQYAAIFIASWFSPRPYNIILYSVFGTLFFITLGLSLWNVKLRKELRERVFDLKKKGML